MVDVNYLCFRFRKIRKNLPKLYTYIFRNVICLIMIKVLIEVMIFNMSYSIEKCHNK